MQTGSHKRKKKKENSSQDREGTSKENSSQVLSPQSECLICDPKHKINHPDLFLDFLSKPDKLEIIYDQIAEMIIKIYFMKSKDHYADFRLKAMGAEELKK